MVQLHRDRQALALEFRGREDGYEVVFEGKPVGVLRMRRRPVDGQEAVQENELADIASGQAADGQWVFQSRDIRNGLEIRDYKRDALAGRYKMIENSTKTLGELTLTNDEVYRWILVEADPNQVTALVTAKGHSLLKILTTNNLDRGRILIEEPDLVESPSFSLFLLLSLYLYVRPMPGVKAVAPSR